MVTLFDLGINLVFVNNKDYIPIKEMAENKKELWNIKNINLIFKENIKIEVLFQSDNEKDRLYIEGLDLLPPDICSIDERGDFYLKPSSEPYTLFDYFPEYYAMRVGVYEIQLFHNENWFKYYFKIIPKNMSETEWIIMKSDLENELRGLSSELIRKNISLGNKELDHIPAEYLYKFLVIKKYFKNITAALLDLQKKPNYRILKRYKQDSLYKTIEIDNVTIKDYLRKGTEKEYYLVPVRYYNYNLPENRWLKKIIDYYEKEIKEFYTVTKRYQKEIQEEINILNGSRFKDKNIATIHAKENVFEQLQEYLGMSRMILEASQLLKSQDWYKTITEVDSIFLPHVIMCDVRYAVFYKLYKELKSNIVTIDWDEKFSYSWKLSSKMYEIWCFIKICRFLCSTQIGFMAKGWIFDNYKYNNILVPDLKSGTTVEFKKNNLYIKAYFDAQLSKSERQTEKYSNPIYTKTHTKPDIRLDLYKDDLYWCSLIFEVKYREIKNFWNSGAKGCKQQIRAYKNDILSPYCRGLPKDYSIRKFRPIDRVWVLHPTSAKSNVIDKSDEGIKIVEFHPEMDYTNVIKELQEEIIQAYML